MAPKSPGSARLACTNLKKMSNSCVRFVLQRFSFCFNKKVDRPGLAHTLKFFCFERIVLASYDARSTCFDTGTSDSMRLFLLSPTLHYLACVAAFDASLTTELRIAKATSLRTNPYWADAVRRSKSPFVAPLRSRNHVATPALYFRGGAISASASAATTVLESLDLHREGLRLEGLGTYGLISALLMNAAITLYFNTNRQHSAESTPRDRTVQTTFCVTSIMSILSCFSTTLVFSLMGLYSKSLLGIGRDSSYVEFMEGTRLIRNFTFKSFRLSLLLFQLSCCLSMYLTNHGRNRTVATIVSLSMVALSCWQYGNIIWLASRLIYQ